jgi:putative ABC transport system permease protein
VIVVRTSAAPDPLLEVVRSVAREQGDIVLDSAMTMDDRLMTTLWKPRLSAIVLSSFGAIALAIAAVGLFGVLAFGVTQRTREIGVRSALGASPRMIILLVLRQVFWIIGAGLAVGLAVAAASVRLLSNLLYGITPYDVPTFLAVFATVSALAALACIVPARRATKVDPLTAFRSP